MADDNEYGARQIQVLEGLEAVRERPAMYIGSVDAPGLHHLVYEVVDNSIDEALAGHCSEIDVAIKADGSVTVRDDGRGIPIDTHEDYNRPAVEVILTELHAGGKFDDKSYQVSGGLHGVGVSVVNALSTEFIVDVKRDGAVWSQTYERGAPVSELERIRQLDDAEETGTEITFWPDDSIFETTDFDLSTLENRMRELAFLNPGVGITLRDEREDPHDETTYLYEGGIIEFVEYLNETRNTLHEDVIYLEDEEANIAVEVAMQTTDDLQPSIHAFANNINTREGGTHMTGFKTALTRVVNSYGTNNNLLDEIDGNLNGEDVREGLTAIISVKHPDPQFEGQTKTKLVNSEVRGIVESAMHDGLGTFFDENPQTAEMIVAKALEAAKARQAAKKAEELTRRKSALSSTSLPGKLADCQTKQPEDAELFIAEGDSAGGCFTGDTEIALASGQSMTFEELVEAYDEGERHYCYTVDEGGRIEIGEIRHPRRTQTDAELVEVTLDDGHYIRCTPDHQFMLRGGEYREAQDLQPGDSLMPLYRKLSDTDETNITIDGYEMVKQPIMEEYWEFTHLLTDRYNIRTGKYTEEDGEHRHHVDFNKCNNSPENLERLSPEEHLTLHREHAEKTLHDEEVYEKLRELRQSDAFRERMSRRMQEDETVELLREQAKQQWEDPEYKEFMKESWRQYYENNPEYQQTNREILTEEARKYWSVEEHREEQSERVSTYFENNPEAVEERRQDAIDQWDDEELRQWRAQKTSEQWTEEYREKRKVARRQEYLEKTLAFMNSVYHEDGSLEQYKDKRQAENHPYYLRKDTTIERYFEDEAELMEAVKTYNHTVKSVVPLDERADVYDIEVPGTHNFALEAGVFVHNSAKMARAPEFQAVLPIRGKVLNVEKHRLDRILENEQIRNIITAIGTGIGDEFDIENLRYHKIVMATDADVDGAHIRTLLLTFLYRHMRPLLDGGYVFATQPPLYRIRCGGDTYDAMTDADRDDIIEEHCGGKASQIQRFKGLGEMNPKQLWDTTMNPDNRILKRITVEDAAAADRMFSVLMGDAVEPRRQFIQDHAPEAEWIDI